MGLPYNRVELRRLFVPRVLGLEMFVVCLFTRGNSVQVQAPGHFISEGLSEAE